MEIFIVKIVFIHIEQKKNSKKDEKVRKNHDYCYIEMPDEDNKILKYNHRKKSLKDPFMIYADLECLLEKMHSCKIILKNLTQKKKTSIRLLVTHCLQVVLLNQQKINLIVTEIKNVWKGFVRI